MTQQGGPWHRVTSYNILRAHWPAEHAVPTPTPERQPQKDMDPELRGLLDAHAAADALRVHIPGVAARDGVPDEAREAVLDALRRGDEFFRDAEPRTAARLAAGGRARPRARRAAPRPSAPPAATRAGGAEGGEALPAGARPLRDGGRDYEGFVVGGAPRRPVVRVDPPRAWSVRAPRPSGGGGRRVRRPRRAAQGLPRPRRRARRRHPPRPAPDRRRLRLRRRRARQALRHLWRAARVSAQCAPRDAACQDLSAPSDPKSP